jgi:hypothetical protein
MLLTGYAGQISLGHAGLMAAGAFTTGILFKELAAPFWITLPASAAVGALLGLVFGLPSLRLRGLYLAVSTLALHFIVVYLGGEYETKRGFSTGISVDAPRVFGYEVYGGRAWYYILLVFAALGIGMALPFVLLTWYPGWRKVLPKPGMWMERLKQFLAFPLYATVAWLVWVLGAQVDNDAVVRLLITMVVLAFALWA